jgi:hypothetical protein
MTGRASFAPVPRYRKAAVSGAIRGSAAEADRLARAAAWVDELASQHSLIVAVTRASFRRRLADRLVRSGWQAEPGRRSLRYWNTWSLRRRAGRS